MNSSVNPATVVSLGHYFYFPTLGTGHSLLHEAPAVTGEATLTPQALVLRFCALPDDLRFELNRRWLPTPTTWVAPHALRCQAQPLAPASVCYHYTRGLSTGLPATSLLKFSDQTLHLTGSVTITTYDAGRQLLSGYYQVRAANQPDPTRAATPATPTCTILLAGDFDNVKLRLA